ncbi:tryptophanase [Mycobacterium intracellulare]|uniref:tryptophanase n=1 Tax=Mycobacterium intracellulare TaxID=1767 RepID=UPI001EEF0BF8|nr:tryptophanase [Mycobacterium intracellulare]MEE3750835.1 tryptophanase [Mycobacterium intracellulare]
MAWLLADVANPCLTEDERSMVFIELGCGENHRAIERILAVVVQNRLPLPAALLDMLTNWLHQYAGSPEEPRLRALVADIQPM